MGQTLQDKLGSLQHIDAGHVFAATLAKCLQPDLLQGGVIPQAGAGGCDCAAAWQSEL